MAVVHYDDEVGQIAARLGAVAVRHLEAEALVLHVRLHARVRLGHAAELGLPVAVQHHPVHVAARGVGLPAVRPRRVETDVRGRAHRVVRVEHTLDRPFASERRGDRSGDAVTRDVRQVLVQEQRRVRPTSTHEMLVEPLPRDPLELTEQMQLGGLTGVAPFGVEQALGKLEEHRRQPCLLQMLQVQVDRLADDALVPRLRRADEIGREDERRVVGELRDQPLRGQLHAVADHAREADLQRVALGAHRLHLNGLARRLRRRDHWLGGEIERNAEHVGVLDVELPLVVQVVRLPAQRAPDHLLAQELRAEGADTENVGDGVRIPSLGEHGHRHHAADGFAQTARLADGVHRLAEQVLVGEVLGLATVAGALDDLAPKTIDLVGGHPPEILVEPLTALELLAVDEQCLRAGERVAMLVEVLEQRELALVRGGRTVLVLALEAGDVVVDQLGGRGVVADDDEAGRHGDLRLLPQFERLFVMTVERLERRLKPRRKGEGIETSGLAAPLLRHVLADVLPEISKHRHLAAGDVLRHRDARQLHDAALDGIHQREVAHRPREERPLGVARPAQEKRRRGEVDHAREAELAVDRLQARDPQAGGLVVALGLLAIVTPQVFVIVVVARLLAIAVMGLVVEHEDVLQPHQLWHDPLEHLPLALQRLQLLTHAPLEERASALRQLQPFAALQSVIVGDDDLGAVDVVQHVRRHQLTARVVAVRVVRLEHPEAVLDRDPGRDDEEAPRKALALGPPHRVHRLPGDQHRHDRRLARSGGQLESQPHQLGVGVVVRVRQVLEEAFALRFVRRHLGEPDRRLCRFDLAEEGTDSGELVMSPVLE